MSSVLRTAAQTATTMLGTVNTVAVRVSQAVNTTSAVLDMADSFVQKHRTKQIASDTLEMHFYLDRLQKESALENAKIDKEMARELLSDANLNELYSQNMITLNPIMETIKARLNPT